MIPLLIPRSLTSNPKSPLGDLSIHANLAAFRRENGEDIDRILLPSYLIRFDSDHGDVLPNQQISFPSPAASSHRDPLVRQDHLVGALARLLRVYSYWAEERRGWALVFRAVVAAAAAADPDAPAGGVQLDRLRWNR